MSGTAEKSEKVQCAMFLYVAGKEAVNVYIMFHFGEEEIDKNKCAKKQVQRLL